MLEHQIGRDRGHGAVRDLQQPEHDHDDADDVVGPLQKHLGRVSPVNVAGERT